jgi:hypothetical protein
LVVDLDAIDVSILLLTQLLLAQLHTQQLLQAQQPAAASATLAANIILLA